MHKLTKIPSTPLGDRAILLGNRVFKLDKWSIPLPEQNL